jgi:hypothetical protein
MTTWIRYIYNGINGPWIGPYRGSKEELQAWARESSGAIIGWGRHCYYEITDKKPYEGHA